MKESDQDGDGKLDYKEFKTIIKVIKFWVYALLVCP